MLKKGSWTLLYLIFILIIVRFSHGYISFPCNNIGEGKDWTDRDDLLCPMDYCERESEEHCTTIAKCCQCMATTTWEIGIMDLRSVFVEYRTVIGHTLIMTENYDPDQPYQLRFPEQLVAFLPNNLCEFQAIVKMDLSWNRIRDIGVKLDCLHNLDTLNLAGNRLQMISNESFSDLLKLRKLDLSDNKIHTLDPSSLVSPGQRISKIDVTQNSLTEVDISNFLFEHTFCTVTFSNNSISKLTNIEHISLDDTLSFGPGMIYLQHNPFVQFPDFEKLGIEDLTSIGKIFKLGLDLRGAKLACNCEMEPFLELAEDTLKNVWRDYYNVTCHSPPHLKGKSIVGLVNAGKLDLFVCNLGPADQCPTKCNCTDQPYLNKLIVNCSGLGLSSIPTEMPSSKGRDIELYLNDNHITSFHDAGYLPRVTILDLSSNNLMSISESAAKRLTNAKSISLDNNPNLKTLPKQFRLLDPCILQISTVTVNCECDNDWMAEWLQIKGCSANQTTDLYCQTEEGNLIDARYMNSHLSCFDDYKRFLFIAVSMGTVLMLIISFFLLCFKYRLEIVVLLTPMCARVSDSGCLYDVYVSFDDDNHVICKWVNGTLAKTLRDYGYNVFIPYKDFVHPQYLGGDRGEAILDVITQTKVVIVVLSIEYVAKLEQPWIQNEWKCAWNNYRKRRGKNIVLINFDQVVVADVENRKIKAFLRVGTTLNFSDRKRVLYEKIARLVSFPVRVDMSPGDFMLRRFENITMRSSVCKPLFSTSRLHIPDQRNLHTSYIETEKEEWIQKNLDNICKKESCFHGKFYP